MKTLTLIIRTFCIIFSGCIIFSSDAFCQNNSDTIVFNKDKGYLLNGKIIAPLSKTSVLKIFPESNSEYLLARKHRARAWRVWGAGAAIFFSSTLFEKGHDARIPFMIGGGLVASLCWFQIPKIKTHLRTSVSLYNQEVMKQKTGSK